MPFKRLDSNQKSASCSDPIVLVSHVLRRRGQIELVVPLSQQSQSLSLLPDTFSRVIAEGCVLSIVRSRLSNFLAAFRSVFPFVMLKSCVGLAVSYRLTGV